MIKKSTFLKCIEAIKNYSEYEEKLNALGIRLWEQEEVSNLILSYTELLEDCCKDYPDEKKEQIVEIK